MELIYLTQKINIQTCRKQYNCDRKAKLIMLSFEGKKVKISYNSGFNGKFMSVHPVTNKSVV